MVRNNVVERSDQPTSSSMKLQQEELESLGRDRLRQSCSLQNHLRNFSLLEAVGLSFFNYAEPIVPIHRDLLRLGQDG